MWIGGKQKTCVVDDKTLISVVIWLQHADSKSQWELPGVTDMAAWELEEITCLSSAS